MRFDAGETAVASTGTAVALSATGGIDANDRIIWAQFKADPDNSNDAYVGVSDVSVTHGFVLEASDSIGLALNPGKYGGTIPAGDIYFDVTTNGEKVSWAILFK
jgi:hypothetical protein